MYDDQVSGSPEEVPGCLAMATVAVEDVSRAPEVQARLADHDMLGPTVEGQLGMFRAVLNAIVRILDDCAVIALVAAGLGIADTLLMSVQERTRETGLMKAMGVRGAAVSGLFSLGAVFIGFLGAVVGAVTGVVGGMALGRALADGFLPGLPGPSPFESCRIVLIVLSVRGIAFLAGTVPAVRAVRKDPIASLRHE